MPHDHAHHHTPQTLTHVGRAFLIGIILNLAFVIIEFISGFYTNSLALLSDAGHNLSDVATLALSLFAFGMAKRKATNVYTYGYHKSTILASLANAVILLVAVGSIGWEAIQRFMHPEVTQGYTISIVAGIGIVINGASAFLFFKDKDHDLNVKGAYLHLVTDALVSAGVVVAGLIIARTGIAWIDPLISIVIMALVLYSTWGLLTESLRLSMDAVPSGIDLEKIKQLLENQKGVSKVHHLHIWAIGTTRNAMTAHLVLEKGLSDQEVTELKHHLKHELEHLNIHHATFETELVPSDEQCETGEEH
jgi:cobalt-zinc-cadmium efflux system protein